MSNSVLRKHHGTDKPHFKSEFISYHLFSKKVAFGRYLLRHIPRRMVEFLIISCKVTVPVEKRNTPSPSCSSFCSLQLQSLFLTQQVQIHAECSTIILIKWDHLSVLRLSFQKDLGNISSLEEVHIVHLSVFKKIATQISIDAYSSQMTLWRVRQFFQHPSS